MPTHKALLLGVDYPGGDSELEFEPLPVHTDLELMESALANAGFETERDFEAGHSAEALRERIRDFIEAESRAEDVRILYFSGHGIYDGEEYLVPAGVSREQARRHREKLVRTDHSRLLRQDSGLVVFIIDACRNPLDAEPTSKGAGDGWGHGPQDSFTNFVRVFSCSRGRHSYVQRGGYRGADVSRFTRAFSDVLMASKKELSLSQCMKLTTSEMIALSGRDRRHTQEPVFSQPPGGDLSPSFQEALSRAIFRPSLASTEWAQGWSFDPQRLNCALLVSESQGDQKERFVGLVEEALREGAKETIWPAFSRCWKNRELLDGTVRRIGDFQPHAYLNFTSIPVESAFLNHSLLTAAVEILVEADLVVFDVTDFEPGVMFLVGVRSAARRGLSLCSHGRWRAGEDHELPFNLQDLSVGSHRFERQPEKQAIIEDLTARVGSGFEQMSCQPGFLDLPAFDALRGLGSDYDSYHTIAQEELVLLLCPYGPDYTDDRFDQISSGLKRVLQERAGIERPRVKRLVDIASPQLVSQTLFGYLRRAELCIVDWTELNPSVFLELGVRLATSPTGTRHLFDPSWPSQHREKAQVRSMEALFQPIPHEDLVRLVDPGEPQQRTGQAGDETAQPMKPIQVHETVASSLSRVEARSVPVDRELESAADSLHHEDQSRAGTPQAIFHGSREVKEDAEAAALERRIAAWLYLERRRKAGSLELEDPERARYVRLGSQVLTGLYRGMTEGRRNDSDQELIAQVEAGVLGPEPTIAPTIDGLREVLRRARWKRIKGDAMTRIQEPELAQSAFEEALAQFERAREMLEADDTPLLGEDGAPLSDEDMALELAEVLGSTGGILRRLDRSKEALASYFAGSREEEEYGLPITYNRVNWIKQSLLTGDKKLAELKPTIAPLVEFLRERVTEDPEWRDRAWAWADLGDLLLLLGNDGAEDEAEQAYRTFMNKAESHAPDQTLEMIRQLARRMRQENDDDAAQLHRRVYELDQRLSRPSLP